jgi:UDP:flavonoid glycosyltransferase YjiC (YdhE family)
MFLAIDYSEVKAMTHFGILCLEATGHLNTIFPLGRELQRRGHCVTVFSGSGAQTKAQAAGFNFCDIYSGGDRKPSREAQTLPAKAVFTRVVQTKCNSVTRSY